MKTPAKSPGRPGNLLNLHSRPCSGRSTLGWDFRSALWSFGYAGKSMPGSGTRTFLDPDRYEASLRQAQIELVVTSPGAFKARLTWAELHHSQLLRCEEDFPRIGYVSLAQP